MNFELVSLLIGENFIKFDCRLVYSVGKQNNIERTWQVRQMRLSVLSKYIQQNLAYFTSIHSLQVGVYLKVLAKYAQ